MNSHFQTCQDKRIYWCWDANEEVNRDTRANSTTTRGVGNLDGRTAAGLMWDTQLVGRKYLYILFWGRGLNIQVEATARCRAQWTFATCCWWCFGLSSTRYSKAQTSPESQTTTKGQDSPTGGYCCDWSSKYVFWGIDSKSLQTYKLYQLFLYHCFIYMEDFVFRIYPR